MPKNPSRYTTYINLVKQVFPFIKDIRSVPIKDKRLEIKIWNVDPKTERDELTISLNHSGTGISQVLAMIYVVMNSDYPKTILIDEPQSFLHPSAIRKLMDIFKQYSYHQYIIATHSPIIINSFKIPIDFQEGYYNINALFKNNNTGVLGPIGTYNFIVNKGEYRHSVKMTKQK